MPAKMLLAASALLRVSVKHGVDAMIGIARQVTLLLVFLLHTATGVPAETDIAYAEHAPLAARSLLLEVTRVGNNLVAGGERGHIVYSQDNGISWTQAEVVPTRATLTSLYAVGERLWAAGHDSVILTSADSGRTWTRQYFNPERQQPIMDVYFANADRGIAIGAYGLMLITNDGGHHWDDSAVDEEGDAHLNAIMESSDGTLLIAGEAGFSYRSRDTGQTWEKMDLPYEGSMFGLVADGADCILLYGLRGHVLRSCDVGTSWEELPTGIEATLLGGAMQEGSVLLVGNGGSLLTYDHGRFTAEVHPSGVDFSSVMALGNGQFLLTGEDGTYLFPSAENGRVIP